MGPTIRSLGGKLYRQSSRWGYGKEILEAYDRIVGLPHIDYLREIDEEITAFKLDDNEVKGRVLVPIIPAYSGVSYRACIIAHAFHTRGYRPLLLTCGAGSNDCCLGTCLYNSDTETRPSLGDFCRVTRDAIPEAFGMDSVSMDEVLADSYSPPPNPDDFRSVSYRDVPVSQFALATTRKYLRRNTVDFSDEHDRGIYLGFLRDGMMLADVYESLFSTGDFSTVIVNESPYVHGGIPLAVAENHGVPGYDHDHGFQKGTLTFGRARNRSALPYYSDRGTVKTFLADELRDEKRRRIDRMMSDRAAGDAPLMFSATEGSPAGVAGERPVIGMFTNLVWDASLESSLDDVPFSHIFEWIETTLDRFVEHGDATLVIKTHPSEIYQGTEENVSDWIDREYGDLPSHIEILPPDTDVSTYRLIEKVDAGLVFTSTVGLEMAYDRIPVVVADDSHYRGFGFTFDPSTETEYRELLSRLDRLQMTDDMQALARRYAYFALIHQNFEFPFVSADWKDDEFYEHPVTHDAVEPGAEPFDTIVSRMVNGEPVVPVREPTTPDQHAGEVR